MAPDPLLDVAGQSTVTVRVTIRDPSGSGSSVKEVPSGEFEATELGVTLERRLYIPWHRVVQCGWILRQQVEPEPSDGGPKPQVRVVLEDGTPAGKSYTLPADRFEAGPWTVTLLLERRIEPDEGVLVVEKVFVPWHRVLEYERVARSRAEPDVGPVPGRPDVGATASAAD